MYQRSEGHVTGLLQLPLSGSQARRIIQINHRSQEVKPISGHTFFQNWNPFSIIAALHPQECITRIDLKNAYHHILIHVNIRKCFRFVIAGKTYQFCVLPFGLLTAPWEFTKTLAPVVQLLRTQGIRVHAYLDDWIIQADSPKQSLQHTRQTIQLLQTLGWTINWKKSLLKSSCILDFLGLISISNKP